VACFDGVHVIGYNPTEGEMIWMKYGAVTRRRALSADTGTRYFASSQPTADRAAWADPGAFPLLIGQKSSSSGIGPQSLSKFRQSGRSNTCSRKPCSSVLFGVLECVLNIRAMLPYCLQLNSPT